MASSTSGETTKDVTARIATLHERLSAADQRLPSLESRIAELDNETITESEARAAFADFDSLWENLIPREQARLLRLLISAVEYDGEAGTVSVTFRPTSIRTLINRKMEAAA